MPLSRWLVAFIALTLLQTEEESGAAVAAKEAAIADQVNTKTNTGWAIDTRMYVFFYLGVSAS